MNVTSKKFQSTIPGRLNSVKVVGGDLSTALRLWKKQQKDSNIVKEIFDRKYYKKKSVENREKIANAYYQQRQKDITNE